MIKKNLEAMWNPVTILIELVIVYFLFFFWMDKIQVSLGYLLSDKSKWKWKRRRRRRRRYALWDENDRVRKNESG